MDAYGEIAFGNAKEKRLDLLFLALQHQVNPAVGNVAHGAHDIESARQTLRGGAKPHAMHSTAVKSFDPFQDPYY